MKVIEIQNIQRRDVPVHYRRVFTGDAVVEHIGGSPDPSRIEFTLEQSALGATAIKVELKDYINYPLVPAVRVLTEHIRSLDKAGRLP
jgi:hypothetical protein